MKPLDFSPILEAIEQSLEKNFEQPEPAPVVNVLLEDADKKDKKDKILICIAMGEQADALTQAVSLMFSINMDDFEALD